LVNVVNQTLPNGAPAIDYLYLDGPGFGDQAGISAARNAKIRAAKMAWLANLQTQLDLIPGGRNIILNGVDVPDTAAQFNPTGAAGVMLDHWSILQYLFRGPQAGCGGQNVTTVTCGHFDPVAMDGLFALARSKVLSNMTLQIKGWVGPVIKQEGHYPPQIPTPTTPAQRQKIAIER
jgi:hypothetical protein